MGKLGQANKNELSFKNTCLKIEHLIFRPITYKTEAVNHLLLPVHYEASPNFKIKINEFELKK